MNTKCERLDMSEGRRAHIERRTLETEITVDIDLDGTGRSEISTGIPFFDHMLTLFARHSFTDLRLSCRGDTEVDYHHSVEDTGLSLGKAIDSALGSRKGIRRYGFFILPMDESLCMTAIDLGGRPFFSCKSGLQSSFVRDFDISLFVEFFRALSVEGRMNIHIQQSGAEAHHAAESVFKSFARSFRAATEIDTRETGIPSSKGII